MLSAGLDDGLGVAIRRAPATAVGRAQEPGTAIMACVLVFALVAAPLPYLLRFDHGHDLTAVILTAVLGALSFYSQNGAIATTMVYLAVLGDYRRYAGMLEGYPQSDPLLLVAPIAAALLIGQTLVRGTGARATTLSRLVLALSALMVVEIFNPLQGGLQIGFAGALFYLAPLLWFWVARAISSLEFAQFFTFRLLVAIGVAATLLGLYQSYFGLLNFEQQWVLQIGYGALYISDDVIRAIGFFSSSAEYQRYMTVVGVTLFALWLAERSRLILLLPLFLVAIFLASARGPVVMILLGMSVTWAVSARSAGAWVPRLAFAVGIGGGLLVALLLALQSGDFGSRITPLVAHQVSGLLDPANAEKSTAGGHLEMLGDGVWAGITSPAGRGLGATTVAAQKYGSRTINAEVDFANVMLSVGVLGGMLYLAIVVTVLRRVTRWWRQERRPYALAMIGVLASTLGAWLIGGEYSICALLWFQIGLIDRLSQDGAPLPHRMDLDAPRARHA